jgi:hypothetical protein
VETGACCQHESRAFLACFVFLPQSPRRPVSPQLNVRHRSAHAGQQTSLHSGLSAHAGLGQSLHSGISAHAGLGQSLHSGISAHAGLGPSLHSGISAHAGFRASLHSGLSAHAGFRAIASQRAIRSRGAPGHRFTAGENQQTSLTRVS